MFYISHSGARPLSQGGGVEWFVVKPPSGISLNGELDSLVRAGRDTFAVAPDYSAWPLKALVLAHNDGCDLTHYARAINRKYNYYCKLAYPSFFERYKAQVKAAWKAVS